MEKDLQRNAIRPSGLYLLILLAAILLDEILNNYFTELFSERTMSEQALFFGVFLLLQIFASPLQAGFSDFYCRKKSLLVSLSISAISLFFIFLYFHNFISQFLTLSIALSLKGILGNTLPLAWAGIADTKNQNYRFSLGLSTATIAIGYFSLLIIDMIFKEKHAVFFIFILFILLIFIVWKKFADLIDRKTERVRVASIHGLDFQDKEMKPMHFVQLFFLDSKSLWNDFLKSPRFCMGLFGVYFPVEVSFYSMHALGVNLGIHKFEIVTIAMILGYLVGVCVLKFCIKIDDNLMVKMGYIISLSAFFFLFLGVVFYSNYSIIWMLAFCYSIYSFGVAFIVPSLFSTLSKERKHHEQGKIYGLLDSTDTIALLFALLFGLLFVYIQSIVCVILFSFILFLISFYLYTKFNKMNHI